MKIQAAEDWTALCETLELSGLAAGFLAVLPSIYSETRLTFDSMSGARVNAATQPKRNENPLPTKISEAMLGILRL